jgi:hypothetical protein
MKLNTAQKVALAFYILLLVFWATLFTQGIRGGFYNYLYSFLFGLVPFFGGIVAMFAASKWGGFKSAVGKGVFWVGLGLFLWGSGENIWSYYNFFMNEPAPYPSVADIGFGPSIFFYCLGAFYLSKATGAKYALRKMWVKVSAVAITLLLLAFSYYLLIVKARGTTLTELVLADTNNTLKLLLDIAYPFGGFLGLLLAVLISGLSFKYLGGKYRGSIYALLVGLGFMFVGDYSFSYTTTVGTFYNANWGDLMLTTGLSLMTIGILGFVRSKDNHDLALHS